MLCLFLLIITTNSLNAKVLNSLTFLSDSMLQFWGKFIHFPGPAHGIPPLNFFQNNEFFHQKVSVSEMSAKDKFGHLHIPSQFHFYIIVKNKSINFISQRTDLIANQYDILNLNSILPIEDVSKEKRFLSSIKDIGTYTEGSCIQILTTEETWIVCLDSSSEKDKFLSFIVELKIQDQQVKQEPPKSLSDFKNQNENILITKPKTDLTNSSSKDGYWFLLQDWTNCTLKCGGGKQVQHWICIPPKQGGKPCEGNGIKEKPCNDNPGPGSTSQYGISKTSELNEVAKPIIKSFPLSNRAQKFMKCVIKENDVFYLPQEGDANSFLIKKPGRIIMNNRTISLFEDENMLSIYFLSYN
jgi:hypothetical protein